MSNQGGHDQRPFFACDSCGIVYAKHQPPNRCRVCDGNSFVGVTPRRPSY